MMRKLLAVGAQLTLDDRAHWARFLLSLLYRNREGVKLIKDHMADLVRATLVALEDDWAKRRKLDETRSLTASLARCLTLLPIIARWADIEANVRTILSYVLRAEAAPVAAMLNAIVSASAQMDMIHAAGWAKLFDPELETFEAVIKIARAAARKRNAIAHHVWAYSDDLPEALVRDMRASLEKLRSDAAEAALIRHLATDTNKRGLFTRLAAHLGVLVSEIEAAIAKLATPESV